MVVRVRDGYCAGVARSSASRRIVGVSTSGRIIGSFWPAYGKSTYNGTPDRPNFASIRVMSGLRFVQSAFIVTIPDERSLP